MPSSGGAGASFTGTPTVRGSTLTTRLLLLNLAIIGIQFTWGVEMTYCTPYLLALGLSKSRTSLVWVAGPLSGLIMQPLVGALADKSTSKYGRRRPFMVIGSVIVGFSLVLLGWTKELGALMGWTANTTLVVAVGSIYAIDFAINAVMSASRSLVIDSLSVGQQQQGSAWAARMGAAGSVVGYFIGSLDLITWFPGFWAAFGVKDQFQCMIVVALVGLWGCVGITSWAVGERVLLRPAGGNEKDESSSAWSVLPTLWRRTIHLPPRIRGICWAQFWGWIGWFPFLFYSSTWVGETYYRYDHPQTSSSTTNTPDNEHDALGNIGRLGSVALVIFSIITFASSVVLPYLVASPEAEATNEKKFTRRPPPSLSGPVKEVLMKVSSMQPDLVTTWMISNLVFAFIMVWAPFVRSLHSATLIVALSGVPWAVSCWAPFAEIGREINKMGSGGEHALIPSYTAVGRGSMDAAELGELEADHRRVASDGGGVLRLVHAHSDDHDHNHEEEGAATGELSGVYLGVLNVYTTLPQFVGTFVSWIVFSILEPAKAEDDAKSTGERNSWLKSNDGPNAISVCLFIGAVCAIVAAEATRRLKRIR